ncbi:tectonin domain-containing protein [Candidatus Riflebacteria bacterium]
MKQIKFFLVVLFLVNLSIKLTAFPFQKGAVITLRSRQSGKYVNVYPSSNSDYDNVVAAKLGTPQESAYFSVIPLGGKTIALKAQNGNYLSIRTDQGTMIRAVASKIGDYEKFDVYQSTTDPNLIYMKSTKRRIYVVVWGSDNVLQLIANPPSGTGKYHQFFLYAFITEPIPVERGLLVSFKNERGRYLFTDFGKDGRLKYTLSSVNDLAKFVVVPLSGNLFAFRSYKGLYLSVKSNSYIYPNALNIGDSEKFEILPEIGRKTALRAFSNKKLVGISYEGYLQAANRKIIQEWDTVGKLDLTLQPFPFALGQYISLKILENKFVRFDANMQLQAWNIKVSDQEKFAIIPLGIKLEGNKKLYLIALRASNGKYACARPDKAGALFATSDRIGKYETFVVHPIDGQRIFLSSFASNKKVKLYPADNRRLKATSDTFSYWGIFEWKTETPIQIATRLRKMAGRAMDISAYGSKHLWIIGTDVLSKGFGIYKYVRRVWQKVSGGDMGSGGAVRIDVDPKGEAWVVNWDGEVFRSYEKKSWKRISGCPKAKDIGVNRMGVWITDFDNDLWYLKADKKWIKVDMKAYRVDVDLYGNPWIIDNTGITRYHDGLKWVEFEGKGRDISITAIQPLRIESNGSISALHGKTWQASMKNFIAMAVAGGQSTNWALSPNGFIFKLKMGGLPKLPKKDKELTLIRHYKSKYVKDKKYYKSLFR